MALEKVITYDYEIRSEYKHIQERQKTAIVEDGIQLSYSYRRRVLAPDADVSSESDEIKGMADTLWSDEVKAAWQLSQHGYPSGDPSDSWTKAQLGKYCSSHSIDYNAMNAEGQGGDSKSVLLEKIAAASEE